MAELLVLLRPAATTAEVLRALLTAATGTGGHVLTHRCPVCGGPHGRPVAEDCALHLSASRSAGLVAAAACADGPVGVDVQEQAATAFDGFDAVALAPGERAVGPAQRAVTWARKEAALKALGPGLTVDPRDLVVTPPDAPPAVLQGPRSPDPVHLFDVPAPAGWACAVGVVAPARPVLRLLSLPGAGAGSAGRARR